jgi:hypothetical protein
MAGFTYNAWRSRKVPCPTPGCTNLKRHVSQTCGPCSRKRFSAPWGAQQEQRRQAIARAISMLPEPNAWVTMIEAMELAQDVAARITIRRGVESRELVAMKDAIGRTMIERTSLDTWIEKRRAKVGANRPVSR